MNNKFRKTKDVFYWLLKKLRGVLYLAVWCMLIYSAGYIVSYAIDRVEEKDLQEELSSKKEQSMEKSNQPEAKCCEETEEMQILPEYKVLYEENSDLYGWIKIEDTPIDYAVMFTSEERHFFYLYRNWYKKECKEGSIFVEESTKADSENVIIYGHNMLLKTMFGSLKEYKNKEYYEEHKYIQFDTLYERGTYEIISVVATVDYPEGYRFYDHVELNSEEEFEEYIDNAKRNAYYNIETTAEYGDQIITLSTCDGVDTDKRLLIIAKKIS